MKHDPRRTSRSDLPHPQLTGKGRNPGLDPGLSLSSEYEQLAEGGADEEQAFRSWLAHLEAGRIG